MTRARAIGLATRTALTRLAELNEDSPRVMAWHIVGCAHCQGVFAAMVRERFVWLETGNLVR